MKLNFRAAVNLVAQPGKPRRFKIEAYNGGPLVVDGFDLPVIVDLQGLTAASSVSIVLDHDAGTETTVGSTDKIENDGKRLVLAGPITGDHRPRVKAAIDQHDKGQRWQASIGAHVTAEERIPEGRTVAVNGQRFSGPVIVARQSELRHTGILPSGADSSTTVNLAAAAAARRNSRIVEKESNIMDFETWCREEMGIDPNNLTEAGLAMLQEKYDAAQSPEGDPTAVPANAAAMVNLRAARAADHRRIAEVEHVAAGHPAIAAAAIEGGWSRDRTEIAVLKAAHRAANPTPTNFAMHGQGAPDATQVLCASFAMTAGASPQFLAKHMGETVVDAATRAENRGASLYHIFAHTIRAAGMTPPTHRMTDSFIRAAFQASQKLEASSMSTVGLPGILSNSANKLLLQGYEMPKTTWRNFCAVGNLNDLKEATRYRMTAGGNFEELEPGGSIKHMALTREDSYTVQAKTYAQMVNLGRTQIINDDLGAFEALPQIIGRNGMIGLEKLIYTKLLSNAGSFFHSNNANYASGGGSALAIAGLTAAEKLFLNQTDANGNPVLITPELLLVPTSLGVTANQLTRDTQIVAIGVGASAAVTPNGNPHAGRFEPIVSPWLENANLTNYSAAGWYLIGRPQGSAGLMEVGFLNGQQSPIIEQGELDFAQLGISLRGYWDFGIAFQDPKFGVFNVGS